jgi:16S rRNA (cytosine967-C5)-methyltransferase
MSRYHSYINTATKIAEHYNGKTPFANYIKDFFKVQKKYGSTDRKIIGTLCYQYFRTGLLLNKFKIAEPMMAAHFLCETQATPLLNVLHPTFAGQAYLPIAKKIQLLHPDAQPKDLFPFIHEGFSDIQAYEFCTSLLCQPDVYLRIRPGKKAAVIKQLQTAKIDFTEPTANCVQLSAGTKLTDYLQPDKDAVIQDLSSQQVLDYLSHYKTKWPNAAPAVWDCCAASGGKSLLLYDILDGKLELTVSDSRKQALQELQKRFATAGIHHYKSFTADLTWPQQLPQQFDLVICDAPCTGSGTWSRTPEQLYFFEAEQISSYAQLQFEIAQNVSHHLKPGALLLYITCSIFEAENQAVVKRLTKECGLHSLEMNNVYGYTQKADSLFWAALQKND